MIGFSVGFPSSSAIESATYDPQAMIVTINFKKRGGGYDYPCTPTLWAEFMASNSKGRFVNTYWVERY